MQEDVHNNRKPCPCDTPVYTVLHFKGVALNTTQFRYSRMINKLQQHKSRIDLRQQAEDEAERQGFKLGECPYDKENE